MSSRLNPREYDLGELRDAVCESPRRGEDGPGDGRREGRADDRSPVEDLLHSDASGGPQAEVTPDARPDERRTGPPASDDGADPDEAASGGRSDRPTVGRTRRTPARSAGPSGRDRSPDGEPRTPDASGDGDPSGGAPSTGSGRSVPAAKAARRPRARASDFELLAASSGGDLERPYLDRLPDAYRGQLEIFEWLEGLLATCGRAATAEALAYYESVGWLSGEARGDLEGFLEGLSTAEPPDPRPPDVDDHRESLRYVARLAHRVER